ncbi:MULTISPECIES: serine--tRNA ligase [Brevibacillus]|jgi:seryl-tRNA synthetase|uniref:Serine--tRNA ligase n=2 Tax=Brevibacillus borstelensis TaxID=45462 RepID=M8D1N0_9BACL|nr:serine--tRNA ligase [Brevibacillus borstelensis]EMT50089.1 seryl-tRNA synthetase [Brevibacillus borstelensis AK1]KKX52535.1 seryl-tRNA synthetase [Brevibacillus borstelensis cifa_chp40]MBE5395186.1 serine--tRNA ligase [Brevibacillus borstelensis]MCC0566529.1 serine--tRNA ligase [Brevibacillus borstelensis]MCM3473074.1 serine--tRNA ligase [Brevibacillus borstelensis]
MLDVKVLRNDLDGVRRRLADRNEDISALDQFAEVDEKRRQLIQEAEGLKNKRNTVSEQVAVLKRNKENADHLIAEMKEVSDRIKVLDEELRQLDEQLEQILLSLPNLPHESVPVGTSEDDNVVAWTWGEPRKFSFEPKPHWELGQELGIIDFETAAKVTGSRFVFYKGLGARLERALMNFMLDLHTTEHGYEELLPPYIVNRTSMTGTGQLPKFEEDAFKLEGPDYFLIPTAEVPVTNMHRDEIMDGAELPRYYAAYSACFRSEAGSAGRDTRGLIRQHQFNKVEMVKFVKPEDSYEELEKLVKNAEKILQLLGLPYRVMSMCTGDLGFTAAKKYDLEVWIPSYNTYREISSCSNFEDFQARRANIRFRRDSKSKPEFVHTLNGSGLAIGRTVAALMENYQQEDGTILIPEVLRPYMGGLEKIAPK